MKNAWVLCACAPALAIASCTAFAPNPASTRVRSGATGPHGNAPDQGALRSYRVLGEREHADRPSYTPAPKPSAMPPTTCRGFPKAGPWAACYGSAQRMGDLSRAAATFHIIDIDADPDTGNLTADQIARLKNDGANKVISYFDIGSCEHWRTYWTTAPGFVPAGHNKAAQLGPYGGYGDETWMNLANPDYQRLLIDYVAPRLVATGVDGFFFDNLEIVEHPRTGRDGPCPEGCRQGGLDLIGKLREKYPTLLFVMQNATSDVTRLGTTSNGVPFPSLLDGISHEEVYEPCYDAVAESQLLAWQAMGLTSNGHPFWIGTEDYAGANRARAHHAYAESRAHGFSPYVADASGAQQRFFYWSDRRPDGAGHGRQRGPRKHTGRVGVQWHQLQVKPVGHSSEE